MNDPYTVIDRLLRGRTVSEHALTSGLHLTRPDNRTWLLHDRPGWWMQRPIEEVVDELRRLHACLRSAKLDPNANNTNPDPMVSINARRTLPPVTVWSLVDGVAFEHWIDTYRPNLRTIVDAIQAQRMLERDQ